MKIPTKGQAGVGALAPAVIAFVIVGLVLVIGSQINTQIQADQTVGSGAYNATVNIDESFDTLGDWLPTIALVLAAVIVIGAVLFLRGRGGR